MSKLADGIITAVNSVGSEVVIQEFELGGRAQNEMLFFFKPECFLTTSSDQQQAIISLALSQFETFGIEVHGAGVMAGSRIAELGIMDRHYGYINRISRSASVDLGEEDLASIRESSDVSAQAKVLGGHEFLDHYSQYDHSSLDRLWATKKSKRLRSGLYFQSYEVEGEKMVLVNGFHPEQLAHFTGTDRRLTVLLLHANTPWSVLRRLMLGDTFPERAEMGSFRRTLHDEAGSYGFSEVTIANNCSHLSAGPFEALFELWNFLSESEMARFYLSLTRQFHLLRKIGVEESKIERALKNPDALVKGIERSLFDVTEEMDAMSSAEMFRLFFS